MTDKEALSSIISCNIRICMNAMENDPDGLPICACTFCKYKENRKNGEDCWAMNIADYILEVIPQLDAIKELEIIKQQLDQARKENAKEFAEKLRNKYGKSCSEYYPELIELTSIELDELLKEYEE